MAGGLRPPSSDELETVAGQLNLTGTVAMAYPPPDRERDLRVAEADGRVAGSAVVQVVGSETVFGNDGTEAFCRGHVAAEHRGRGIGAALLRWTLGRAAAEPGVRDAWTQVRDPDGVALLEAAGFRHDRTGQVMRNTDPGAVPEPDWPAGIRVDTSLRGERLVEAVTVACDRAFADLPRYRGASRANVSRLFAHPDADPTLCFLAVRDGEPVGLNFCLLERRAGTLEGLEGWIHDLGVAPEVRGVGFGRALLLHGVRAMARRGAGTVLLGVDAANQRARRLYQRTGFVTTEELRYYRLPLRG
jgi:mycothiol synthase